MQKVLVSFLFFLGIMLIFRSLIIGIPKWRAYIKSKKDKEKISGE